MTARRLGRLARLEGQSRNTSQTAAADPYAGLPIEELRALYLGWTRNPAPCPELEGKSIEELTALYFRFARGP